MSLQHIPNFIINIQTSGSRIVVGDVQESFSFVRYKAQENQLIVFADDTSPRWITSATMLDFSSVAGADKFGNITVVSTSLSAVTHYVITVVSTSLSAVTRYLSLSL